MVIVQQQGKFSITFWVKYLFTDSHQHQTKEFSKSIY